MRKLMWWLFYALFFVTPLLLYFHTSEIFEFNKIIFLYIATSLVTTSWIIRMILEKKIVFRRTALDMPLFVFLGTQAVATILSIDFRTSLLGYYGRWNGGLVSTLCYALLYWAYVSNMSKKETFIVIRSLFIAAIIVCLYGVAQHFGVDKDIWVQDVQNRVFSTLGQPNWLAAWVVALMPITWAFAIQQSRDNSGQRRSSIPWIGLSALLFTTLLYTKSRAGLLGFGGAFVVFWVLIFFQTKRSTLNHKPFLKSFLLLCSLTSVLCLLAGTPWTPSIIPKASSSTPINQVTNLPINSTSLESGGTESGEIRKIVWKGAFDIWKNYPILGTGLETFAFAYYMYKPPMHNYTSEWDYLYNKAHNEYLNYLTTTGVVGFISYLILIGSIFYLMLKNPNYKIQITNEIQSSKFLKIKAFDIWHLAFISGFASILVTNFFGFSVVPVSLLFFLFPAMTVTFQQETTEIKRLKPSTTITQKLGILFILCTLLPVLLTIFRYWYADTLYLSGKRQNDTGDFAAAQKTLTQATEYSPNEAIYWDELAETDRNIAIFLSEKNKANEAHTFAKAAIEESSYAIDLSPTNVNLKRNRAVLLTKLSGINPKYLSLATDTLIDAVKGAPTDPKLQYALAASYYRLGKIDIAIDEMKKAVEMKTDYKDSRFALAMMYVDAKKFSEAKKELEHILEKIDGKDKQVKKELDNLK